MNTNTCDTEHLEKLIERYNQEQLAEFVYFWGHQESKSGQMTAACFSQWWSSAFEVEGTLYPTAEHWMMAHKARLFADEAIFAKVVQTQSPKEVKSLGRQIGNFDDETWRKHRFEIVVQGNLHKFSQNSEIQQFLLDTQNKVLVEASPVDAIWGVGLAVDDVRVNNPNQWEGLNLLGFALMEVRRMLVNKCVVNDV